MLIGHNDQAAVELDRALPLAELPYDTADVIGLKGALARNAGTIAVSIDHLEDAIGRLGVPVPQTALGLWWGISKEVAIQAVHTTLPGRLHRHPSDRADDLCNWLLGQVEYCYYVHSVPKLLWASTAGMNRAERVPESSSLSLQYFVHANDMAVLGWHTRAEKYYRASFELSHKLNDRRLAAVAVSHHSLGSLQPQSTKQESIGHALLLNCSAELEMCPRWGCSAFPRHEPLPYGKVGRSDSGGARRCILV